MEAAAKRRSAKKKNPNRIRFFDFSGRIDIPMLVITLVLLAFGITMMFSAGHALSMRDNDDSYAYAKKQMMAAGIGLGLMVLAAMFDYRLLRKEFTFLGHKLTIAHFVLAATLFLTFLVIPLGVSNIIGGPRRWIQIPLFGTFQPSDFLKVGLIVYMAYYIHKNSDNLRLFKYGIVRPGILFVVVAALMMYQPHLSGLLIMTAVCGVMLYVGGINWKPILLVVAFLGVILAVMLLISDFSYFYDRIALTFTPEADIQGKTYQSYQSVLAIGSGGLWGVGFGNSAQKYGALPEAQNDFVFAILVEELGFVGGAAVILLFLVFIIRGFDIARHAEDKFGMMLGTGITFQIGIQALLNIGVNVCCIPNTGISLPFFSYGGTALMVQLAEVGLLLSVSKRSNLN